MVLITTIVLALIFHIPVIPLLNKSAQQLVTAKTVSLSDLNKVSQVGWGTKLVIAIPIGALHAHCSFCILTYKQSH